jgi:hypothetical protein
MVVYLDKKMVVLMDKFEAVWKECLTVTKKVQKTVAALAEMMEYYLEIRLVESMDLYLVFLKVGLSADY